MFQRTLSKTIKETDASFPVLLVTGPRQVGKITLLEMCADERRSYVTLNDVQERDPAQTDPALFLQSHRTAFDD